MPYSDEEKSAIIALFMDLKANEIRSFLESYDLTKSGTKEELRKRIEEALDNGDIEYSNLVQFFDQQAPWQKQHVFLYKGPRSGTQKWRNANWVGNHLRAVDLQNRLNAPVHLVLPEELTVTRIEHNDAADGHGDSTLRVFAVEKLEAVERHPEEDYESEDLDALSWVQFKAYLHSLHRGMMIFEWNLTQNTAMLQVLQLPSGYNYEDSRDRFISLLRPWLDIGNFDKVKVSRAIKKLDDLEASGTPEAKSQHIAWDTLSGRRWEGRSNTSGVPLRGDRAIDNATNAVRRQAVGRNGNFWWLPAGVSHHSAGNPLSEEARIEIVGNKERVNFPRPYGERIVRYVLRRIRALSR